MLSYPLIPVILALFPLSIPPFSILSIKIIGEVYACIPERKPEISLIAEEPCNVLFLNISEITGMCHLTCPSHNQLIRNLLFITSKKNIMLTQKMEYIIKKQPEKNFFRTYPHNL